MGHVAIGYVGLSIGLSMKMWHLLDPTSIFNWTSWNYFYIGSWIVGFSINVHLLDYQSIGHATILQGPCSVNWWTSGVALVATAQKMDWLIKTKTDRTGEWTLDDSTWLRCTMTGRLVHESSRQRQKTVTAKSFVNHSGEPSCND